MENISSGCYVIDSEYNIVNMNDTAKNLYPQLSIGEKCYKCLMNIEEPCGPCPVAAGKKGPNTYIDPIRNVVETVDAVDIDIPSHGPCHMLIFSTVGVHEEYAASLPFSINELTNLAMIQALTVEYCDVFSANIEEDMLTLFRLDGKPVESTDVNDNTYCYSKLISDYAAKYVHEADVEEFLEKSGLDYIRKALKKNEYYSIHYRVILNGELHYYVRFITRIGDADTFSNFVGGIACEDEEILVSQHYEKMEHSIAELERDSVTGLYTREAFLLRGDELLKKYPDHDFDYCICRLDNLSMILYQYGKNMVDKILNMIGERLLLRASEENCIGYLGDGTFASFTMNYDRVEREKDVMEFRNEIFEYSEIRNLSLKWSIYNNIGRELSIQEIMEKTAFTLNAAGQGMNHEYIEFDKSIIDKMSREMTIESGLMDALDAGEIRPWYQPQYSFKTKKIVGAEALARWITSDGSFISPADFIPICERSGQIGILDEAIFKQVCDLKHEMKESGIDDLPISVNVSRASLFKKDIATIYSMIADSKEADKKTLPIEITESVAVRASMIHEFADRLKEEGFPFHMDDFGSGYSSLATLIGISFDCIKIDKSLVDCIGQEDNEKLLKHTVALAKEFGMKVIAEGVETFEQYLFLKVIGCDMAQGYYFSRPVDKDTFLKILQENRVEEA